MKVVNKFTVVAVAAATLLALAGCGGSGDKGNAQSGIAGATANLNKLDLGTVTLNVWAPQQNQQPGPNGKTHIIQIEADFQKAHPGVKFKNAVVGEADAGKTVGQDPTAAADVYMYANDQLGALIKANGVGAQTNADIINSVKIQNSSVMLDSITQDGKIYGVPYTGNTWFMYYNNSMLNKNDVKSLDTMLSKAKIAFPLANSWYFPAFYLGAGGTLYGSKGTDASAGVEFNKPDVTKYLVNLAKNPNYDISTPGLAGDDAGLKAFEAGKVAAYFSGTWDGSVIKDKLGDKMSAAQLPTYTMNGKENQMKSFAGSKAVGWNPSAKIHDGNTKAAQQKAAQVFAAYLGGTQSQRYMYEDYGQIPSDVTLTKDAKIKADPIATAQFATIANTSVLQPTLDIMNNNFWTPATNFGANLANGTVTLDNAVAQTTAFNNSLNGKTN